MLRIAVALITLGLLTGCTPGGKVAENIQKMLFKFSFVQACSSKRKGEAHKTFCTCLANDLISSLTIKELQDEDKVLARMKSQSIGQCRQQVNKPIENAGG